MKNNFEHIKSNPGEHQPMGQHRKMFVHIGQSKCGSTSIQSFLSDNDAALRSKGILHPTTAQGSFNDLGLGAYMEHQMAFEKYIRVKNLSAENIDNFDAYFEASLLREIEKDNPKKIVVSWEGLLSKSPYQVNKLLSLFKKISDDINIFAVLRRQDRWAVSSYNTRIVAKGIATKHMLVNHKGHPHGLQYAQKLMIWQNLLGPDAMTVTSLEDHKDILIPFKELLGISGITAGATIQNIGLSAYSQEVIRTYNEIRISQGIDAQDQRKIRSFLKSVLPHGKAMRPAAADVAAFLKSFTEDHEKLKGTFLPPDSKFFLWIAPRIRLKQMQSQFLKTNLTGGLKRQRLKGHCARLSLS